MKRPQFRLKQLFAITTLACVVCSLVVLFGMPRLMILTVMILAVMTAIAVILLVNVFLVLILVASIVARVRGGDTLARFFRR